jgi:hypothetical protein
MRRGSGRPGGGRYPAASPGLIIHYLRDAASMGSDEQGRAVEELRAMGE